MASPTASQYPETSTDRNLLEHHVHEQQHTGRGGYIAAGQPVDAGKATDLERLEVLEDAEVQGRHEPPTRPVVIRTPHQVGENPAKMQL